MAEQVHTGVGLYEPGSLPTFDMRQAWVAPRQWEGVHRIELDDVDGTLYQTAYLASHGPREIYRNEREVEDSLVGTWHSRLNRADSSFSYMLEKIDSLDWSLKHLPEDEQADLLERSGGIRTRIAEIQLRFGEERIRQLGAFVSSRADLWVQAGTRSAGKDRDDILLAKLEGLAPVNLKGAVKAKPVVAGKDEKLSIIGSARYLYLQRPDPRIKGRVLGREKI